MHLQIAANISQLDELGQLTLFRRLDFAQVFPQLRGNPREAELGVDLLFRAAGQNFLALEKAVFIQLPSVALGAVAQRHVMFLRAGEVLQRGAVGGALEQAHVNLQVVLELHADLVFTFGQNRGDAGKLDEVVGDARGVAAGHQQGRGLPRFRARGAASRRE